MAKVKRIVATYDIGSLLNDKTGMNQLMGGITWGVSFALHEEAHIDPVYGRTVNESLAEYHVPVNANIGAMDITVLNIPDVQFNPIGSRGIGEIGITGAAAGLRMPSITPLVRGSENVSADQVIQGHKQIIERAHANGLKIYGCTVTPVQGFLVPGTSFPVFTLENEAKRQAVNAWIRTNGEYDAVIDFDRVLRDPDAPAGILPVYDSGDHGHPTDAGYRAPADSINLRLFSDDDRR